MLRRQFLKLAGATAVVTASSLWGRGRDLAQDRPISPDFNKALKPIPLTAKFSDPDYNIWCGSMVDTDDGTYHLFYSRWPRTLGHNAWVTHSEIAHAIASSPLGPYSHVGVALQARGKEYWDGLCTHNPTILSIKGKYYLYYTGNTGDGVATKTQELTYAESGVRVNEQKLNWTHRNNQRVGVAVADSAYGPWTRFERPLVDRTPGFFDAQCCSNPAVAQRPDGSFILIYKAVGDKGPQPFGGPVVHIVATSDNPLGPFKKFDKPVFTKDGVMFAAEDPYIWWWRNRYWAIVKDNAGNFTQHGYSLALFCSEDGFDWDLAEHPFVTTPELNWSDGKHEKLAALERPQIWSHHGEPAVLFCAAATTANRDHSFNVAIPLTPFAS